MKHKIPTVISLDKEQVAWIETKVEEGYSKSGLVRHAIKRLMEEQETAKLPKKEDSRPRGTEDEKPEKYDITRVLGACIKIAQEGSYGIDPSFIPMANDMIFKLNNVEFLSPRAAFELGIFKGEMEEKVSRWFAKKGRIP